MNRESIRRASRRLFANRRALIAAPAFALALTACGGGAEVASTDSALAPVAADAGTTNTETSNADTSPDTAEVDETGSDTAEVAGTTDEVEESNADAAIDAASDASGDSGRAVIPRLSADEAIANAEVNQPNLQPAQNVLDIETLAVADGSIQTLRGVVDGDRPVLLWFFSPH